MRLWLALILLTAMLVGCGGSQEDPVDPGEQASPSASGDAAEADAEDDDDELQAPFDAASLRGAIDEMQGPLGEGGDARFLLGFMTQALVDGIPVDAVDLYNTGVEQVHAWVVYDGVESGEMSGVLRTGPDEGDVVAEADVVLTDPHGWTGITFERPDTGWPVSQYEAVIAGDGTEIVIEFTINYHNTTASSLVDTDGEVRLPGAVVAPGGMAGDWHVVDVPTPEDGFSGLLVESGRCLAFNYRGDIVVSDDGQQWQVVDHPFEVAPTRFGAANGRFFGFTSSRPNQYVSGDGTAWTRFEMGSHDPLVNIVHTHDGYIGSDERRIMLHSEDGTTWKRYEYEKEGHSSMQNVYLYEVNRYFYHDGRYHFVTDEGLEMGAVMHDLDTHIPLADDAIAGARVIISGDRVLFWRHGTTRLWAFTGSGFAEIDTDLGGTALVTIVPRNGGYVGVRGDGTVLESKDAVDWKVVAESPEGNLFARNAAIVGNRLVVIFEGVLYSLSLD